MNRLFRSLKPENIRSLVKQSSEKDSTYKPANFLGYFAVDCPPGVDPEVVAKALSSWQTVKTAYVEAGPTPPPIIVSPNDPHWSAQRYLGPAPVGIDAEYAWSQQGGDADASSGALGLQFVDLEQGWTLNHVDLNIPQGALISGFNKDWFGHGTAVLGIVAAVADNNQGGIGITPRVATKRVVSQWRDNGAWSTSEAILDAINVLNLGDLLLLEAEATRFGRSSMPIEVWDEVYDAIRLGTALGIIIVEAAGNGSHDLDNFRHPDKGLIFNRNSSDFQDSGAIMVGAASSAPSHQRMFFSNFGSRIDCYAWGEKIYTAGDGHRGNLNNTYIENFGGTSGAAAIIAGAALSLQGYVQDPTNSGNRLTPQQLRNIFRDRAMGTPSANGVADLIGVMPNLRKIIDEGLKRVPDPYWRDFRGDTGDPHMGAMTASPDIILCQSKVPDPQAAFSDAGGTENINTRSFEAKDGQDNYIYVRLLNRGFDAARVKATVYWSSVATLERPTSWKEIGSVVVPSVPRGSMTVSDVITWPANNIPDPGRYCFIGLIGNEGDPAPVPTDFLDRNNFDRFVRNHNNVVCRNINVRRT